MVAIILESVSEILEKIAERARAKRLALNLSQHSLSERSGVSLGVIKKFERTGKISVESLLKMGVVLDALNDFNQLFRPLPLETLPTLDDILKQTFRKRGRK